MIGISEINPGEDNKTSDETEDAVLVERIDSRILAIQSTIPDAQSRAVGHMVAASELAAIRANLRALRSGDAPKQIVVISHDEARSLIDDVFSATDQDDKSRLQTDMLTTLKKYGLGDEAGAATYKKCVEMLTMDKDEKVLNYSPQVERIISMLHAQRDEIAQPEVVAKLAAIKKAQEGHQIASETDRVKSNKKADSTAEASSDIPTIKEFLEVINRFIIDSDEIDGPERKALIKKS